MSGGDAHQPIVVSSGLISSGAKEFVPPNVKMDERTLCWLLGLTQAVCIDLPQRSSDKQT